MTDDQRHSELHVGHRDAAGRVGRRIDNDAAIHFLIGDRHPAAVQPNFGPLIGRAVKTFGKSAGDIGRFQPAIVLRDRHGPMIGDLRDNGRQCRRRAGLDFDQRIARIVPRLADRDPLDAKRPAAGRDQIENLRQNQAIDNVAAQLDFLDETIGIGRGSGGGIAAIDWAWLNRLVVLVRRANELYDESVHGAKPSRLYFRESGRHNANTRAGTIFVARRLFLDYRSST